jgi:hypothetical protein
MLGRRPGGEALALEGPHDTFDVLARLSGNVIRSQQGLEVLAGGVVGRPGPSPPLEDAAQ